MKPPGSSVTALPPEKLDAAAARLAADGYHVVRLDVAGWRDAADMHAALGAALHFPDHYGRNLDALNDSLRDVADGDYGRPAESAGLALVLDGYDHFARTDATTAHALLDVWTAAAVSGPADGTSEPADAASGPADAAGRAGRPDPRLRCLVADPAAAPNRPAGSA